MNENNHIPRQAVLQELFAENRAEWATDKFGDLFVPPTYLSKLETLRPCFLVGGRGTGKTTSLQSLRFDATYARLMRRGSRPDEQAYFGVLVRMNKNRVRAFLGSTHGQEFWSRLFVHYFNLLACLELSALAIWLEDKHGRKLSADDLGLVCGTLGVVAAESTETLRAALKQELASLELQVNNPATASSSKLSIAEAPIRAFVELLRESGLIDTGMVFCCIDEYENLHEYQQSIINTYIKHAEPPLSYKIGVRKNGIRSAKTLDSSDALRVPDDYLSIEISEEGFEQFAASVAEVRLAAARKAGVSVPDKLSEFLVNLDLEAEAVLLGAEKIGDSILDAIRAGGEPLVKFFLSMSPHSRAFIKYWHETDPSVPVSALAADWQANPKAWEVRYGNYAFAALFWLSKGSRGVRIRKFYCGERVLLAMASGNIRYFLELIEGAISLELADGASAFEVFTLSPKSQTLSAREVGFRRISQLDGVTHGVALKRLVLGIGRVFFARARDPAGQTPEVTSFVLTGSEPDRIKLESLLREGVAHLAFEASPRTKATSDSELRDEEYRIHPIFSAFFEISHRRKRRMSFDATHVLGILGDQPGRAISLLAKHAKIAPSTEVPEQLGFFSAFYGDGDSL